MIVAGDFGLVWDNVPSNCEKYWTKWLKSKPWTTLFCDGNHENFPRLAELPTKKLFGGKVGVVDDGIYHVKRGEILTLNNKTFFFFGGAESVDRVDRTEGKNWWREEIPSTKEMNHGLDNLYAYGNNVNYIITHTAPKSVINRFNEWRDTQHPYPMATPFGDVYYKKFNDPTTKFLDHVKDTIKFDHWYCGHFHEDWKFKNHTFLYIDIKEIT